MSAKTKARDPVVATKRVAIYTRQSVDRSTEMELGSLQAQREAIAAYVKSQAGEGWFALPEKYDDGGFSGGTMERPAFQRMLADIRAGRIDIVACYKIDRLSRSLLDFAEIMRLFGDHGVTFVSVTQSFNTTTPMGTLTLNVLMSFAEFERQVIAERTRDKIAAMRRRGIWCGGHPLIGYDNVDGRLKVNEDEAIRVREIFALYLKLGSMSKVLVELDRRGWVNKTHVTKRGKVMRGKPFDLNALNRLLKSPLVVGRVPYRDEVHPGAHTAIVDENLWTAVQHQLATNRERAGADQRNKHGAVLRGIIHCARCGSRMINHFTTRGPKSWHFYVCPTLNNGSPKKCRGSRVPAGEIEKFVLDRIRGIARDPTIIAETILAVRAENERKKPELIGELNRIGIDLRKLDEERRNLVRAISVSPAAANSLGVRLGEIDERSEKLSARESELRREVATIDMFTVNADDVTAALSRFDPVWDQLIHQERARLLQLVIERINFDAAGGEVEIKFRDGGIEALAQGGAA